MRTIAAGVLLLWSLSLALPCVRSVQTPGVHSVYPSYVAAGHGWLAGTDIYAGTGYRYSPLVAALFAPFALVPDRIGDPLWRLLSAGVYIAGLTVWGRRICASAASGSDRRNLVLFFLLVLPLSVSSLNNGQANTLVLGLMLLALDGVVRERWTWAAGCIALAGAFKIYPLFLGVVLVAMFPRRLAARLLILNGAVFVLPFLFQHPAYVCQEYASWLEHLRHDDRQLLPLPLAYRDLRLLLRIWITPIGMSTYLAIQLLAAGCILVGCRRLALSRTLIRGKQGAMPTALRGHESRQGWHAHAKPWAWHPHSTSGNESRSMPVAAEMLAVVLALSTVWMTLLGPATESCTYILLAPSFAEYLLRAWDEEWPSWRRLVLCGSFVLVSYPDVPLRLPGAGVLSNHAAAPLGALLFAVLVLDQLRRAEITFGMFAVEPGERRVGSGAADACTQGEAAADGVAGTNCHCRDESGWTIE